jgi:hypothetical protein
MKHIELETAGEEVKRFVLSLELDQGGSLLELHGNPVARVVPVAGPHVAYDRDKLKAAILARRDESRRLNAEWEDVDQEAWSKLSPDES